MNYIAKQIPPEWQQSPLFLDDFPDNIAVFGNRAYKSHIPETVQAVIDCLEAGELASELELFAPLASDAPAYDSPADAIAAYLPPEKGSYTAADIAAIQAVLASREPWSPENMALILTIQTGREWSYGTITGDCQGDWQHIVFPADEWPADVARDFEVEYFNLGAEWEITDETGDDTYTIYTHAWDRGGTLKEIADVIGCNADEISIHFFNGFQQVPTWEGIA